MDLSIHVSGMLVAAILAALLPPAPRRLLLMAVSILLYGVIDWRFPVLLWAIILVAFSCGFWLERASKSATRILICCFAVLSPLAVYKYLPVWFGSNSILPVSGLDFGGYGAVLVPVGLSFYSFQCCGYLIDVHRRLHPAEKNLLRFGLFASFYPVLLAGPIERFSLLGKQLWEGGRPTPEIVLNGLLMIAYGVFLKEVLGDRLGIMADDAYTLGAAGGWDGVLTGFLSFTLQLLADFGGYSLIAVGAGLLFGVELTRNFRQPFFAETLPDFWQRWHISLTRWIGDYVYRPTGLLLTKRKSWPRFLKEAIAAFVTWVTMGLWHGAETTYVVFGMVQAGLMLAYGRFSIRADKPGRSVAMRTVMMATTFSLVVLTFAIIRAPDLPHYGEMLWALITLASGESAVRISKVAVQVTILMLTVEAFMRFRPQLQLHSVWGRTALIFGLLIATILFGEDDARNFIYFRF